MRLPNKRALRRLCDRLRRPLWRRHSCLPRRDSSRRSGVINAASQEGRDESRPGRQECLRHATPGKLVSNKAVLAACAAGLCLAVVAVKGQQDAPTVFRADTRVVVCNTTVVDKNGHLVTDLSRENFSVSETGWRRRFPTSNTKMSRFPWVDHRQQRQHADQAWRRGGCLAGAGKRFQPDDEVFVVNFNDEPFLDLPNKKNFTITSRRWKKP